MRTKYILLTILSSLVFASCNYLDFDETNNLKTKEDMYKYFGTSKSMLTHVYSYMPQGYQLFRRNFHRRQIFHARLCQ